MKLLRDVALRHLLTVTPTNNLRHVARLMSDRGVGSAVVIEKEEVSGIITERDILHAAGQAKDFEKTTVADMMTRDVVSGDPGWDIVRAIRTMNQGGFRHLLVMDGSDPVGIVSIRDLMSAVLDLVQERAAASD